jgi:protein-tyrosine phosphatase
MVDIHCHLLPGIDDGPDTLNEALQMAEAAIAGGITHVVATPHANDTYDFNPERVKALRQELAAHLGGRLALATGCDFHLNAQNLKALEQSPASYTINQKNYLLVEFSEFSIPRSMDQTLHQLQLRGLTPVITHPERNAILRQQPERLARWIHQGCAAQVTGGALIGGFGPSTQKTAEKWVAQGLIHFVASDAHNLRGRPPELRAAYEAVKKQRGEEIARALLVENPLAAFEGRALPYIPEVEEDARHGRRKRFFFF